MLHIFKNIWDEKSSIFLGTSIYKGREPLDYNIDLYVTDNVKRSAVVLHWHYRFVAYKKP